MILAGEISIKNTVTMPIVMAPAMAIIIPLIFHLFIARSLFHHPFQKTPLQEKTIWEGIVPLEITAPVIPKWGL